jgi:hypothetical protein
MNSLKVFEGVARTTKGTSLRETASFDVIVHGSSETADPFLLGAVTINVQNNKLKQKETQSLYVDPLWARPV